MTCELCDHFRCGVFVDWCALQNAAVDYNVGCDDFCDSHQLPCPDIIGTISCHEVNNEVNSEGRSVCDI